MFIRFLARAICSTFLPALILMTAITSNAFASADLDYLSENKKKAGVQVTSSGLQYRVLRKGTGRKPSKSDAVEVHYKGSLINGKVFDSSYDRGQSISFPLNRVIAGWTEGLQLMKVGAKYELVIPSNLGYGVNGAGRSIPPRATLIFEVELLKVH
jgi:FKBP-type peptidyl-prolyl cis-trans isomerase